MSWNERFFIVADVWGHSTRNQLPKHMLRKSRRNPKACSSPWLAASNSIVAFFVRPFSINSSLCLKLPWTLVEMSPNCLPSGCSYMICLQDLFWTWISRVSKFQFVKNRATVPRTEDAALYFTQLRTEHRSSKSWEINHDHLICSHDNDGLSLSHFGIDRYWEDHEDATTLPVSKMRPDGR